ncbi:MAG: hypothetical protein PF795_15870 [Kiritimatiellae bacterium]|jgi:hypothetical protein|nr:hypothetical protein [Kiritimatiellia bacterium]
MKKNWKTLFVVIGSILLVATGLNHWLIDGLEGVVWGTIFEEDTEYAEGYTGMRWRKLRVGMTDEQVISIIGEPLNTWTNKNSTVGMSWSQSPGDTHYRSRVLTFADGSVIRKHMEFYVD